MNAKRAFAAYLVTLLTAVLVLALGAPAHADPKRLRLGLSATGPFTDNLAAPLFSGSYVPGSATSTFWVKNDSTQTTRATISVVPKASMNSFEQALSFTATVGGTAGNVPVPLYQDKKKNQCRTIVTGPTIDRGGVQKVDLTMLIDENYPQPVTQQTATFSFVVTLSQVTNKGKVDVCGPQSPGGQVEVLGAQAKKVGFSPEAAPQELSAAPRSNSFVYALAAGFLAAGGMFLVAARRRRREPVEDLSS